MQNADIDNSRLADHSRHQKLFIIEGCDYKIAPCNAEKDVKNTSNPTRHLANSGRDEFKSSRAARKEASR